jgi:heme exporter protein C
MPLRPAPGGRLHRFANPGRFLRLTDAWLPWLTGAAVLVLGIGTAWALAFAPPDWQQGETVRIMYVHVPMAWLAMGSYLGLAILSVMSLIWRHPLADLAARELSPWAPPSPRCASSPAASGASRCGAPGGCGMRG